MKQDNVNQPPHYTEGGIEAIKVIQAKLSEEGFLSYCMGNVMKYVMRSEYKGKRLEDLKKAQYYLNKMIENLEENNQKVK
jgi:hypothetical protein